MFFMKKIILILLILNFYYASGKLNFKLTDYHLNLINLQSMVLYNDKVYVLGSKEGITEGYNHCAIKVYDGEKWDSLPQTYLKNNEFVPLKCKRSYLYFDSQGSLWMNSKGMMRYKDGKWEEFLMDDKYKDYRTYSFFCIDIYDNIWIITWVYKYKDYNFTELLKFDGKNFTIIDSADFMIKFSTTSDGYPVPIAALPDGRVCLTRTYDETDVDFYPEVKHHIRFYNQDGTYQNMNLEIKGGHQNENKIISSIYPEINNKIWFTTVQNTWHDGVDYLSCCSGISLFENNEWTVFDEKNGLPFKKNYDSSIKYDPVYRIAKIDKQNYIVNAARMIYTMGPDYILKPNDLLNLGKNSTIIRANGFDQEYHYAGYFKMINSPEGANFLDGNQGEIIAFKNEVWIKTGRGILTFPQNVVLSLERNETKTNENVLIYPNPVVDVIKISGISNYSQFKIFNILGKEVISGNLSSSEIDVEILNPSPYYFIIYDLNGNYYVQGFIKQ